MAAFHEPAAHESLRRPQFEIVAVRYELKNTRQPPVRRTLPFGEQLRFHAMGRYGRMFGGNVSPILSGHEGTRPAQGHRHAFFLPTDEDDDGLIDHVTIYARGGFDDAELQALQSLSFVTWGHDDSVSLTSATMLTGSELARVPAFTPRTRWRSTTPMVLYRHPKKYRRGAPKLNAAGRQIDGPEDQLHREWGYRQAIDETLPNLVSVHRIPGREIADGRRLHWLSFARRRHQTATRATNLAFGFDIEFESPVPGPIAVGYGAHFGMGQFAPAGPAKEARAPGPTAG